MNDKSKKKSIIMALAVFAALAVLSSPLLVNDNSNNSSNIAVLGVESDIDWTDVATLNELNNAISTDSYIRLTADIEGNVSIVSGTVLTSSVDENGNKYTLTGTITLNAGATLQDVSVAGNVIINSEDATEESITVIEDSAIFNTAGLIAINATDIQKGTINILGNTISVSGSTTAALNFEGVRDVAGIAADKSSFNLNIKENTINNESGRAISGCDKIYTQIEDEYLGGNFTISNNVFNDDAAGLGTIAFRNLHYNSIFTVTNNEFNNGAIANIALTGGNILAYDVPSYLDGVVIDDTVSKIVIPDGSQAAVHEDWTLPDYVILNLMGRSSALTGTLIDEVGKVGLLIENNAVLTVDGNIMMDLVMKGGVEYQDASYPVINIPDASSRDDVAGKLILDKGASIVSEKESIAIIGTVYSYDGSSLSNIKGNFSIEAGSLLINGSIAPVDDNIVISGDITITGDLDLSNNLGANVTIKPVIDESGNVANSNVVFNVRIVNENGTSYDYDALPLNFIDANGEAVTDPKLVANVTKLVTDDAGQETLYSNESVKNGVTVEVSDLTYNGDYQKPAVVVTQHPGQNNLKVLTKIIFKSFDSEISSTYAAKDYKSTGLHENGINANVEDIIGDVAGFKDLEIKKAGIYTLIYTVSTNIVGADGENAIDEDFEVIFNVNKKQISEVEPLVFKVYDGKKDAFGNIITLDICDGDEVTFLLEFKSPDAGLQPLFITGLNGNDADNYILSSSLDINTYNECDLECPLCNGSTDDSACTCDKLCLADWELFGYIFQKTITEDMIEVTNIAPTFNNPDTVFPMITVTIGDKTYELDTSKIGNRGYLVPFEGFFINSNGNAYEFDEGIPTHDAGSYYVFIESLNYADFPELRNYTAGPLVGLANSDESEISHSTIAYFENLAIGDIDIDIDIDIDYQDMVNWFITIPINGEGSGNAPITDMADKTLILLYYLAYAEEGAEINGELFISENDGWTYLYSESLNNSVGIRAWYFSFLDQLADRESVDGDYQIVIYSNNVEIAIFEFSISDGSISDDDQSGKNLIFGEDVDLNYVQAWASKQSFEAKSGMVIKYHYIYSDGSERHFEQIIRPELSNLGVPYYYSNVGANSGLYSFLNWTTLGDANLYPDVVENEEFFVNSLQSIDSSDLKEYAIEGVLNLYAVYDSAGEPVRPEGGYAKKVATFYDIDAKTVQDMMNLYGVQVSDVASRTFALIYEQYGCSEIDVKGVLYKLVDGELMNVYSEETNRVDGVRSWYFSFDDQANRVVEKYGLAGYYDARIVAVDSEGNETELLSTKFHIAEELYGVNITANYETINDGDAVKIFVEPKNGCLVPTGKLLVNYTVISPNGGSIAAPIIMEDISESNSTLIVDVVLDTEGLDLVSSHAVFRWVDNNGNTVYSLSNMVKAQ